MARHSSIVSSPRLPVFFSASWVVNSSSDRVPGQIGYDSQISHDSQIGHNGYTTRKSIGNVRVSSSPIELEQLMRLAVEKKAPSGLLDGRRPI